MASSSNSERETAVVSIPETLFEGCPGQGAGSAGLLPGVEERTELLLEPKELAGMDLPSIAGLYAKAQEKAQGGPDSLFAPVAQQLRGEAFRRLKGAPEDINIDSVWEMLEVPGLPDSFYSLGVDFLAANGCAAYLLDSLFLEHVPETVRESAEIKFHAIAEEHVDKGWLSSLSDLLRDARREDHYREKCVHVCPHLISLLHSCAKKGEELMLEELAFRMPHLPNSVSEEAIRLLGDKATLPPSEVPIIVQIPVSDAEDGVDIFLEEPLNGASPDAGKNRKPVPFDPKNKPTQEVRLMDNPFKKGGPGNLHPKRPSPPPPGKRIGNTKLLIARPKGNGK